MLEISLENYNDWAYHAVKTVAKITMRHTGYRVITTPHILLGVLRGGPAANLLNRTFGMTALQVTEVVENMPRPVPKGIGPDFLYTDGAYEVLDKARELATQYDFVGNQVYTDHLLMALVIVNDEAFAHVMSVLGVDHEELMAGAMGSLDYKHKLVQS